MPKIIGRFISMDHRQTQQECQSSTLHHFARQGQTTCSILTMVIILPIAWSHVITDTLSATQSIMYYIMCDYSHGDAELWR
jgi:hypothetical protein